MSRETTSIGQEIVAPEQPVGKEAQAGPAVAGLARNRGAEEGKHGQNEDAEEEYAVEGRQDTQSPARVETDQAKSRRALALAMTLLLAQDERGDEESAEGEEEIDP